MGLLLQIRLQCGQNTGSSTDGSIVRSDVDRGHKLVRRPSYVDEQHELPGHIRQRGIRLAVARTIRQQRLAWKSNRVDLASSLFKFNFSLWQGSFVGAFASTNLGDVSPNLKGPHCLDTGLPCDNVTSTCDGDAKKCVSFGPGKDMFESTEIIAKRLFGKASVSCTKL